MRIKLNPGYKIKKYAEKLSGVFLESPSEIIILPLDDPRNLVNLSAEVAEGRILVSLDDINFNATTEEVKEFVGDLIEKKRKEVQLIHRVEDGWAKKEVGGFLATVSDTDVATVADLPTTDPEGARRYVIEENNIYRRDGAGNWEPINPTEGESSDHGGLTGLADDDHPQYHTNARGDARYYQKAVVYTKTEIDAGYAVLGHNHNLAGLAEKSYNSLTDKPSLANLPTADQKQALVGEGTPSSTNKYVTKDYADLHYGPGAVDHGATQGLEDDDHPQYLTNARGDSRYYLKSEVYTKTQADTAFAAKLHNHALLNLTERSYNSLTDKPDLTNLPTTAEKGALTGMGTPSGSNKYVTKDYADANYGGTSDHGSLLGLSDDDHPQYHNDARGDIRYYRKTEVYTKGEADSNFASAGHNHALAGLSEKAYASLTGKPDLSALPTGDQKAALVGEGTPSATNKYVTKDYLTDNYAPAVHNHALAGLSEKSYNSLTDKPALGNLPTADEKAALAGEGTPSASNKYVTKNYLVDNFAAAVHNHTLNSLTEKSYNSLTDKPDLTNLPTNSQKAALVGAGAYPPSDTNRYVTKEYADANYGGQTDHGALTGLSDDDHAQYHNDARGDLRYYTKAFVYTKTEADNAFASLTHNHSLSGLTEKSYNSLTDKPNLTTLPTADEKGALAGEGTPTASNKYVTKSYADSAYASYAHNHSLNNLNEKSYNSLTDKPDLSNMPSTGEKAALVGTYGTPGPSNKYVTQTDPKYSGGSGAGGLGGFPFGGHMAPWIENSSTIYEIIGYIIFSGTNVVGTPAKMKLIVSASATNRPVSVRLYDVTNAQQLCEITGMAALTPTIYETAVFTNLPATQVVVEIHSKTIGGAAQMKLHYLGLS